MFILLAIKVSDSTENIVLNVGEILYIDSAVKNIKELRAVKQQSGQDVTLKHFDIELKNVGFAYKDGQKIIDGVSFVAKQNEITALVGPSGCVKTTLLRLLSRLYDYQEGQITIDGKNIQDIAPIVYLITSQLSFKTLRCLIIRFWKIFTVVQDVNYQLFTESVWSEISLVSDDDVVKKDALTQFGLIDKIERHPQSLSGGEKQRLLLAMAKASNKPIIVLDEPISGLFRQQMDKMIEDLQQMAQTGKIIIVVTHDYELIKHCKGRIIEFVE